MEKKIFNTAKPSSLLLSSFDFATFNLFSLFYDKHTVAPEINYYGLLRPTVVDHSS